LTQISTASSTVQEYLVQLAGVGPHERQVGGQERGDADPLVLGAGLDDREDAEEGRPQVDRFAVEL
jgi:hypothetical protein